MEKNMKTILKIFPEFQVWLKKLQILLKICVIGAVDSKE